MISIKPFLGRLWERSWSHHFIYQNKYTKVFKMHYAVS